MTSDSSETPTKSSSFPLANESAPQHDRYVHSDIFDKLVAGDEDLVGLVAYGLYQQRKREWVAEHLSRNKTSPSEDDLKAYSFHYQANALEALTHEAEGIMYKYGEEYIRARLPELQQVAFNEKTVTELVDLKSMIRHISGYGHHVVGHVLGFMVLVLLFYFFTRIIHYEPRIGDFLGIGRNPSEATGTVTDGAAASTQRSQSNLPSSSRGQ